MTYHAAIHDLPHSYLQYSAHRYHVFPQPGKTGVLLYLAYCQGANRKLSCPVSDFFYHHILLNKRAQLCLSEMQDIVDAIFRYFHDIKNISFLVI